jgi:hypothetical protein
MRTSSELDEALHTEIRAVYTRPAMYAAPEGIETVLWTFHRAWALLHRREDEFQGLYNQMYGNECASGGLYRKFQETAGDFEGHDAYRFILQRWSQVSNSLGIDVSASFELTRGDPAG